MKYKNKIILIVKICIVAILIFSFAVYRFNRTGVIKGKVVKTDYLPEYADNGHYYIFVREGIWPTREINATGKMNMFAGSPKDLKCISTPALKVGSEVEFFLPKDNNGDYNICFKLSQDKGYFLRNLNNN